ncbi:MAG TPA: T9SS type A sorting domain-containing protein [Ignavibacteriaceae bacterium]|nr:T9SS type A sorting domain-containing protein [Ignavibacteriaceae bacterium]
MKRQILIIFFLTLFLLTDTFATELNGRVRVLNNDGRNYQVVLQVNTDLEGQKLGGATMVINLDTASLYFPDDPVSGTDFSFSNFNLGYYDTAKVTTVNNTRLWINIDLTSDNHGTELQKGPDSWTDLVVLNFSSDHIITGDAVSWNPNSEYWHVYDSDNSTLWSKGTFDNVTDVESNENKSNLFSYNLDQNYPNPFNPTTKIEYRIPERSPVKLVVYNTIGQEVSILADGEKEAGSYSLEFNASGLPSGIYFYRIQAGKFIQTKKMVLLK